MTLTFLAALLMPSLTGAIIVLACVWMAKSIYPETGIVSRESGTQSPQNLPGRSGSTCRQPEKSTEAGINYHQIRRKILEKLGRRMKGEKV